MANYSNLTELYYQDSDMMPNNITMAEAEHLLSLNDENLYTPTAVLEDEVLTVYSGLEEDTNGNWGNNLFSAPLTFNVVG